jgi:hypothetical protein
MIEDFLRVMVAIWIAELLAVIFILVRSYLADEGGGGGTDGIPEDWPPLTYIDRSDVEPGLTVKVTK